jgi:hypothetical protein
MKKVFASRSKEVNPATAYYDNIANAQFAMIDIKRKKLYDWLNATDAPKAVWDALEGITVNTVSIM